MQCVVNVVFWTMDNNAIDKSGRLQSNEEVIEELTRDLESSCIKENESTKSRNVEDDSWNILDKEHNEDEDNDAQNIDPSEDVDEELLKDRDLLLTEADQEVYVCDMSL